MKSISAVEFKRSKNIFTLLDVRGADEIAKARIDPHIHIPMKEIPDRYVELDKEKPVVVICHTGVRSAHVCSYLEQFGYDMINMEGGIEAWSLTVDPSVPRY
ncbi:MAG: rhodanese-like domain-containing protein [Candidatus Marinimicrobia bacterium]|jgi:rhodanese-related sulfurtransferase|nr:rhodanese-like domain-containing protein [Candidatus Neomarinimicrobiota bacterium]|tara:strand:- start:6671 stop:6976 length:306 start_codon:yes stop_codon:yes gene_type:complete